MQVTRIFSQSLLSCLVLFVLHRSTQIAEAQVVTAAPVVDIPRVNVYKSDDLVLVNPVEGTAILAIVLVLAAGLERGLTYLRARPERFFHTIFESILQECMLVGLLAMILTFVGSLGSLSTNWVNRINNAVLTLFILVVLFALVAAGVVFIVLYMLKNFKKFELSRMQVDPVLSAREQIFKESHNFFRFSIDSAFLQGEKNEAQANATGGGHRRHSREITLPISPNGDDSDNEKKDNDDDEEKVKPPAVLRHGHEGMDGVLLSDYIRERCTTVISTTFDLSWKSWTVLAFVVAGDAIRVRSILTAGTDGASKQITYAVSFGSFVFIVGFVPIAVFFALHRVLERRLYKHLKKVTGEKLPREEINAIRPSTLLFFGSMEVTVSVIQILILLLEWYLATIFSMISVAFSTFGAVAVIIIFVSLIPIALFLYIFPWTVIVVTLISHSGVEIDADLIEELRQIALYGSTVAEKQHQLAVAGGQGSSGDAGGGGSGGTLDGALDSSKYRMSLEQVLDQAKKARRNGASQQQQNEDDLAAHPSNRLRNTGIGNAKSRMNRGGGSGLENNNRLRIMSTDISLEPGMAGATGVTGVARAPDRMARANRGTHLLEINDEWDDDLCFSLADPKLLAEEGSSGSDSADGGTRRKDKSARKRESSSPERNSDSNSDIPARGSSAGGGSSSSDPGSVDLLRGQRNKNATPDVGFAIKDMNYHRAVIQREREEREQARASRAADESRYWDPLRPTYLPDWRHNPVLAQQQREREEARQREGTGAGDTEMLSLFGDKTASASQTLAGTSGATAAKSALLSSSARRGQPGVRGPAPIHTSGIYTAGGNPHLFQRDHSRQFGSVPFQL